MEMRRNKIEDEENKDHEEQISKKCIVYSNQKEELTRLREELITNKFYFEQQHYNEIEEDRTFEKCKTYKIK